MLVVYMNGENTTVERGNAPKRWDISPLGKVVSIEFYKGELDIVCIALTNLAAKPEEGETFNIQLAHDQSILSSGYSVTGKAPAGRLFDFDPTDEMTPVPTEWTIDLVDTCKPIIEDQGRYKAIHLCHCVRVSLPVAA